MAKFSGTQTRTRPSTPVRTEPTPTTRTYNGALGFSRDAKSDLFLLGISNMVGEKTFYEGVGERDERFTNLVAQATAEDPQWVLDYATWLRRSANMRSASVVVAATAAKTAIDRGITHLPGTADTQHERAFARRIIDAVCVRADEPAEVIGYWFATFGRSIPKPVKRGVADAVQRLYTEQNALRYDGETRDLRMADVVELSHPHNRGVWQGALYEYLLTKRHGRKAIEVEPLPLIAARIALAEMPVGDRRAAINRGDESVRAAGHSWETLSGWLADGAGMDAMAWEFVIPDMGYMALLRNLRNFDKVAISDATVQAVKARLTDPDEVARSRQLPFRFYSAYKAVAGTRWLDTLEAAFGLALANVPSLDGHTLILVDRSGSMFGPRLSEHSEVAWSDAAALFGTAFAMRAAKADLVQFGSLSAPVAFTPVSKGGSVLRTMDKFGSLGGTDTRGALRRHYQKGVHTRVIIVTDEQANNYWGGTGVVDSVVGPEVPVTTINLVGYGRSQNAAGANRFLLGGLSDASFTVIPLLERGREAGWPWEINQD